jgi:ribonuclease BN (tRNA processing enzyme)
MRIRVLGAHQGEDSNFRFTSLLIDGWLAVDAGALTSTLSLAEQLAIKAVVISHSHWDHVKDLPTLAYNFFNAGRSLQVICQTDTFNTLRELFFTSGIWPDLTTRPSGAPTLAPVPVEPGETLQLEGYDLAFFSSCHKVPTLGVYIEQAGRRMVFTSDTASGCVQRWLDFEPHLLITELTLPDSLSELARQAYHLTPKSLAEELASQVAQRLPGLVVAVIHRNPFFESALLETLQELGSLTGLQVVAPEEGDEIEV